MKYDTALSHFGGNASEMARILGLPTSTVLSWKRRNKIPRVRQLHLQAASQGKLVPESDIFRPAKR